MMPGDRTEVTDVSYRRCLIYMSDEQIHSMTDDPCETDKMVTQLLDGADI